MNRLLPILVLFSLILAGSASAAEIDWDGLPQFQRGNRITPNHMNDIIDALDSVKTEVDALTVGGSDSIRVNNGVPTIANSIFDLRDGDGINITLGENSPTGTDSATFDIQPYTGSGLIADGTGLSLRRDCTSNYVLQWNGSAWVCAEMTGGGGGADMTVNGLGVVTNFFDGADTGSTLYVDFLAVSADVTGSIDMSAITQLGTITTPTTIANQLTLSTSDAEILFSTTGTASCGVGEGSIYWDGASGKMKKCENGITTDMEAGAVGADLVLIDSTGVNDEDGVNFLGGDGVTIAAGNDGSTDTATVAVALGNNQGLEVNSGTLGLITNCTDTQVLAWDDNAGTWGCAAAGAGSAITVNGSGAATNLVGSPSIDITNQGSGSYQFTVDGTAVTELGTLTTQIVTDELGVEFTEEGTVFTDCTTDFGTSGGIFYDDNVLKKCENGTLTDLAPDVNNITGNFDVSTGDITVDQDIKINGTVTGDRGRLSINGGSNEFLLVLEAGTDTPGSTMFQMQDQVGDGIVRMFRSGNIHAQGISDIDGPGTNWSIAESGAAQFNRITDSDPSPTWSIGDSGAAVLDNLVVGEDIGGRTGKVEIGGESTVTQLIVRGADGQPGAGAGNPLVDLITFSGASVIEAYADGEIRAQAIQDFDGPGTNFSIAADGTAEFNNTTVEDLTSTGTLAHSGGTATLSSGATDTVALGDGADTLAGKVEIGGTQDQPQLVIEGHSDQTDSIVIVQDDADTEVFNIENDGTVYAQSIQDMELCQDRFNDPAAGGGEQTLGLPDGVCDLDDAGRGIVGGTTLQAGKWGISSTGRASFTDLSFNGCEDNNSGTNVPQTALYSDGICDDDGVSPARGRLVFNDSGFDGTTDYVAADGPGAGENAGALAGTDAYISTKCIEEAGQFFAYETGCDMDLAVGRRAGFGAEGVVVPHITLKDGVLLPGNPSEESVTQIQIGAAIVPAGGSGSTAEIAMGGKTITGGIAIDYLSGGDYLSRTAMTNKWFFINGTNIGATLTITLGSASGQPGFADQDGRSACFYAASADRVEILSDDGTQGSDFILNGTRYAVGASGSPSITSSGSQGDFVCIVSANPDSTGTPEWYVLGQSGTWTGTQGAN